MSTLSVPTHVDDTYYRPYIQIQMKKPNGTWSSSIYFNFDTGASSPTDVPPQILSDFGGAVPTDDRVSQQNDIRIPGYGPGSGTVFNIPVMIQDQDHYDLFASQPERKPLLRVHDLMPFMSIIYEKTQTTLRDISLGNPPDSTNPANHVWPTASQRTGTPTSGWYWTNGQCWGPTCKTVTDLFNVNTGDRRFIIKRSTADSVHWPLTPTADPDDYDAFGNFIYSEAVPPLVLTNVPITVREDTATFARGGSARNLMGGFNFLDYYKILLYGQNLVMTPLP